MSPTDTKQSRIAEALRPFSFLFAIFDTAGFQLYAVGGCVRDWALGLTPKDIDFTTDATPAQIKQILSDNGCKVIPVGEAFGTIATLIHGKSYEITTFRVKESYARGSRHPMVCYGHDLERDLERRDLTINAMAATLRGEIIDPFDGLSDLDQGILRVPRSSYEKTIEIFQDDPLRILRLARFKARLQFDVSPETTRAAQALAGSVLTVSHERWFSEIDGLLRAAHPIGGMTWLCEVGVWPMLFPELELLDRASGYLKTLSGDCLTADGPRLRDVSYALLEQAPAQGDQRWCALLALVGYGTTSHGLWADEVSRLVATSVLARLKFSNVRLSGVVLMLSPMPEGSPTYRSARQLAIDLGDHLGDFLAFEAIMLGAVCPQNRADEAARLEQWRAALAPYLDDPCAAAIHLPGDLSSFLMAALGVRGKTLGLCLDYCREAVLDHKLDENASTDEFVAYVKAHLEET